LCKAVHAFYLAIDPPAFSIFVFAEADTVHPVMTSFFVSSPSPSIFTARATPLRPRTAPRSRRVTGFITSPVANMLSSTDRLMTAGLSSMLLNAYPRSLGSFFSFSRTSGRFLWPARAFWPLVPRPEVLPRPPPRPTRLTLLFVVFVVGCGVAYKFSFLFIEIKISMPSMI